MAASVHVSIEELRPLVQAYAPGEDFYEIWPWKPGFSGARLWRVALGGGDCVLRRWPEGAPTAARLGWIHRVVARVAASGFPWLAVPRPVRRSGDFPHLAEHDTFVRWGGALWTLEPLLPGTAAPFPVPRAQLVLAMEALAQFHVAAQAMAAPELRPSPGWQTRQQRLDWAQQGGLEALEAAWRGWSRGGSNAAWPPGLEPLLQGLLLAVREQGEPTSRAMTRLRGEKFRLQPCLRDIWRPHVLFAQGQVTGIVDYGAIDWETTCADVARLLGSLAGEEEEGWHAGLAAYRQVRELPPEASVLCRTFDRSSVVISALNWLQWLVLEKRHFDDGGAVVQRLGELLARLETRPFWR